MLNNYSLYYYAKGDEDLAITITDKWVQEKHFLELEGKISWLIHENRSRRTRGGEFRKVDR